MHWKKGAVFLYNFCKKVACLLLGTLQNWLQYSLCLPSFPHKHFLFVLLGGFIVLNLLMWLACVEILLVIHFLCLFYFIFVCFLEL